MQLLVDQSNHPERRFGITLACALWLLGIYDLSGRKPIVGIACIIAGTACGVAAVVAPKSLAPLSVVWSRFGEVLGRIVSPIVLGIIFFGIVTPVAVVTRMLGRDELRLRYNTTESYWIRREPNGSTGDSFKNQF